MLVPPKFASNDPTCRDAMSSFSWLYFCEEGHNHAKLEPNEAILKEHFEGRLLRKMFITLIREQIFELIEPDLSATKIISPSNFSVSTCCMNKSPGCIVMATVESMGWSDCVAARACDLVDSRELQRMYRTKSRSRITDVPPNVARPFEGSNVSDEAAAAKLLKL